MYRRELAEVNYEHGLNCQLGLFYGFPVVFYDTQTRVLSRIFSSGENILKGNVGRGAVVAIGRTF